jgi:hypothetical protein
VLLAAIFAAASACPLAQVPTAGPSEPAVPSAIHGAGVYVGTAKQSGELRTGIGTDLSEFPWT